MHIVEVGKLYHPNKTRWQEGGFYQCAGGEHRLELFFNSPSPKEIKSVKSGVASFGFLVQDELICFLFRFYPDIDWSDSPFSIHLVLPEGNRVPPLKRNLDSEMPVLTTFLIDASTGILLAIRSTSLNLDFANRLESEILNQLNRPFDSNVFDKNLALLYDRYPTVQSMLQDSILS